MKNMYFEVSLLLSAIALASCTEVDIHQLPHVQLPLDQESNEYTTPCLEYKYFKVEATEPCMDLQINVTHKAGEPNLYVSKGLNQFPTLRNLAWSSYNWGGDSITVSSNDPDYHTGTFYIGVHAYCGNDVKTGFTPARYTVRVSHVPTNNTIKDLYNGQTTATLQANKYSSPYRFCAPKQCVNISVTLSHCMSYNQTGCNNRYGYPELLISKTILEPKVTDMAWMLAEMPRRTIVLNPSDPNFEPGHYYMSVYGWCTPGDHCPDQKTCGPCNLTENLVFTVSVTPTDLDTDTCNKMMEGRPKDRCSVGEAVAMTTSKATLVLLWLLAVFVTFN